MRQYPNERTPLTTSLISQQPEDGLLQPENNSNISSLELIKEKTNGGSLLPGEYKLGSLSELPSDILAHIMTFVDLETKENKKYNIILTCRFFYLVFHTHFLTWADSSQAQALLQKINARLITANERSDDLGKIYKLGMYGFYQTTACFLIISGAGLAGYSILYMGAGMQKALAIFLAGLSGSTMGALFTAFCCGSKLPKNKKISDTPANCCFPCCNENVDELQNKDTAMGERLRVRYNLFSDTEENTAVSSVNNLMRPMNGIT